tara:strand:- start:387 stop:551 length:165 start_codon:yes stop_codon:yes gene_type:complete
MAKSYGDPSKLSSKEVSARTQRAVLRGDPPNTYKKGGKVHGGGKTTKGTDTKIK